MTAALFTFLLLMQAITIWRSAKLRAESKRMAAVLAVVAAAVAARAVTVLAGIDQGSMAEALVLAVISVGGVVAAGKVRSESSFSAMALLARNPNAIHIKDADGRFIFVNSAFEENFGKKRDNVIGKTTDQIWPEKVSRPAIEADQEALKSDSPATFTVPIGDEQKTSRLWRGTKFRLPTIDSKFCIVTIYADVTIERARENRLALASEYAGIWEWDINNDSLYASPAFIRLLGFNEQQSQSLNTETINNLFHPDDFPAHRRRLQAHLANPTAPYESAHRLRMPDGKYRWFKTVGGLINNADSTSKRVAGSITDIHDERTATEALRINEALMTTLLNNAPFSIYFKDENLKLMLMNRRYSELYKIAPRDVLGKTSLEIFGEEPGRAFMAHDAEALRRRDIIVREERLGDLTFLTAKFPVIDRDGNLIGIGGIETDITDRVAVEQAYRFARDQAERANRAKSEFLANMSHELRTPLNSVIGFSDSLLAGTLGPLADRRHENYIGFIKTAGEHLLSVINDILDLSRIEAGSVELEETDVDLAAIFSEAILLITEPAKRAKVSISDLIGANVPHLSADPRQIKQVLLNLLSNAVKFTPEGGHIRISAKRSKDGGVELRVSDNGIGIGADDIKHVQEPFAQVASAMTREHQGSGLGLAIVRSIVLLHDGQFELQSEPGRGTVAIIRFPASRVIAGEP